MLKHVSKLIFGLVLCTSLASCYVPDNFGSEIRITKDGNYGITYSGELIWAPLYGQLARGEISQEEAAEQIPQFMASLKEDKNFKSVTSLGKGRFDVRFDKRGRFDRTQMISFVRRTYRIFQIRANEDGKVSFFGSKSGATYAEQLEASRLQTRGLLRIVTDAEVLTHNATAVRPAPMPGYVMYDWKVESFRQPAPKLILQLMNRNLPTTGPGLT